MDNILILELYTFLTTIYGGIIAGLAYDLYRTIRYFSKPNKIMTYLEDFLLWLIIALIFFFTLTKANLGEIRGYIVFGFFLGVVVYMLVFSKYIYPLVVEVMKRVKKIINTILSFIILPFTYIKKKASPEIKRFKRLPKEIVKGFRKYKSIISSKK